MLKAFRRSGWQGAHVKIKPCFTRHSGPHSGSTATPFPDAISNMNSPLTALSPLDGRYASQLDALAQVRGLSKKQAAERLAPLG